MTYLPDDRTDIDRLIRLLGMLGSPNESGFWDSWRTDFHGYSFTKMKTFIVECSKPTVRHTMVNSFGSYTLKFFSAKDPEAEAALVKKITGYISGHAEDQPAIQFLSDLRATAWRLTRDYSSVDPKEVVKEWATAELS